MEDKPTPFLSTPVAILLGSLVIAVSILVNGGVIKLGNSLGNAPSAPTTPAQAPTAPTGPVKVSVDDDPILGSKDAPVTLIEFSDYECPFCKRHFDQTYPDLKKDYIDSGKVKLVFRDLPLPFHDPMATFEAMAANCAKEQGGDATYFKFHDEIFKRTKSNGNGLTKDDVYKISTDLGLNTNNLRSCVEAEKYKDEVQKDIADANTAGASGTPTFFIGKSTSGKEIEGQIIVGAQPYSAFQTAIDALLK